MSAQKSAEIAARLDRLPPSRTVWRIVILISLGGMFEFYDLFFTGYVAPGLVKSGLFTPKSLGFFAALHAIKIAGFGTFVFSTFAGLWVGLVLFGRARTGSAGASCSPGRSSGTWSAPRSWRFRRRARPSISGVSSRVSGFGVQLVTIDAYISEIMPRAERGRAFSINQVVLFSIVPVVALLAWLLVPLQPAGFDGWRWVVLIGSVGAIVVWFLVARIPESPRWLAMVGRLEEAERITADLERRVAAEKNMTTAGAAGRFARGGRARLLHGDFRAGLLKRTVMLSLFNAAQVIGFYGFAAWVPSLLIARGITITHSLEYSFIIAIANPFGPLLGTLFADRIERKTQIVLGLLVMGIAMAAFSQLNDPAALIVLGVVFTLASNVMSYAYHNYQSELYPTRIRAQAVGFVYSWSRLAAAFAGLAIGALLHAYGVSAVAIFIGVAMLVGIAMIGLFGPATKGLALEQINS